MLLSIEAMREIKFRAWHEGEMIFVDSIEFTDAAVKGYIHHDLVWVEVDGPVMQFTGLKDRHHNDIYEGDILEYSYNDMSSERFPVIFQNGSFSAGYPESLENGYLGDDLSFDIFDDIQVVGNIYEHPKLLTQPTTV
jgi:hypothetical protein